MPHPFRDWIREKILDRIETIIAAGFARSAEARLLRSQMTELQELEQLAEDFEADGKPHLAQVLRQRSSQLMSDGAADSATALIENLSADEQTISSAMRLTMSPPDESNSKNSLQDSEGGARPKRRGRPPKPKTTSEDEA